MDRRKFICTLVGGIAAGPQAAFAQPAKLYRIGFLSLTAFGDATLAGVLLAELRTRGYVVGRNIAFEERVADSKADRLAALAAELVRLDVDMIVAGPAVAIRAAHDATTTIPIVMAFSADDPVKSGFVASLARPGGNVTGVTALARDLAPKWTELLREAVPGMTRLAVMTNPARPEHAEYVRMMTAARPVGLQLQTFEAQGPGQYESAFAAMTNERAVGVVILGDVMFTRDSRQLAALALSHRLPSIYLFRAFTLAGGLMTYGPDEAQLLSLAGEFIDKILQGANPAELPVQQPTMFKLALNMKTANALHLAIPQSLRLRAQEVVE